MERSLHPPIRHVDLEVFEATERRDSLDWINGRCGGPLANLYESVVERGSLVVVSMVESDAKVEQELLCLERSVGSRTGQVYSMMQEVPSLLVYLVNICPISFDKLCYLCIVPANHCVLESVESGRVNLIWPRT